MFIRFAFNLFFEVVRLRPSNVQAAEYDAGDRCNQADGKEG